MYVTGTDVSGGFPPPKDRTVQAFRGYTTVDGLSILYYRTPAGMKWLCRPFWGQAPLPSPGPMLYEDRLDNESDFVLQ
jgi:hypothetical protein